MTGTTVAASSLFFIGRARAEDPEPKYTIKLATVAGAGTPWEASLKQWRKRVKEATGGQVKIKPYWGGALGDEQTTADRVADGAIQAYGGTGGGLTRRVPELEMMELPYLFPSLKKADEALDFLYPEIDKLLQKRGYKLLFYSENGWRSIGLKGGFVKSIADLKGKKMRSQQTDVYLDIWKALGASPQAMPVTEVMSALTTGACDGFDNTPLFSFVSSWYQAIDHFTVTEHSYQPGFVLMSKKYWDELPSDIQTGILGDYLSEGQKSRAAVRRIEPMLLKNFENAGIAVHKSTAEEKAAFKRATQGVAKLFEGRQKDAGKELLAKLKRALG